MKRPWHPFVYHTVDIRKHPLLPIDWADQMVDVAKHCATTVTLKPIHVTSREQSKVQQITTKIVGGLIVREQLPWLYAAYHDELCQLGSMASGKILYPAKNVAAGVVLNVMTPETGRYEAHADSNPVQGMLYAQTAEGGQLVMAHDLSAIGVGQIDADASVIEPTAGQQLFFDGRRPHYVRAVSSGMRVAAAMNYYDSESTEAHRPSDLTDYLNARPGE